MVISWMTTPVLNMYINQYVIPVPLELLGHLETDIHPPVPFI